MGYPHEVMYEKTTERLLSIERFLLRLLHHALYVVALLGLSAIAGAGGFMVFEGHDFTHALLHAIHILSGLGLLQIPESLSGRFFAAGFGLYASLFFLAAFSIVFAPVVHRILHKMHLEDDED